MSIDSLDSFLITWNEASLVTVPSPMGNEDELVTKVALRLIGGGTEDVLKDRLVSLSRSRPVLKDKISKVQAILSKAHEKSLAEIEEQLGLTEWNAGPNTSAAKGVIVDCFLKNKEELNLSSLGLTSLPLCIKDLNIKTLECSNNELTALPPLPESLRYLRCQQNKLTELPGLPSSLVVLNCSNNELTGLAVLPLSLSMLYCNHNALAALPFLPGSLLRLECAHNALPVLPLLPELLVRLDCSNNQIETRPNRPSGCITVRWENNPFLHALPAPALPAAGSSSVERPLQIPGEGMGAPLWCRVLMDGIRQNYRGEDYSLVVSGYKMWCNERGAESTVTIQPLEGGSSLTFVFDGEKKLARIQRGDGSLVSLDGVKGDAEWSEILDKFAGDILERQGIQVEDYTLRVHPDALQKFPEKIFERFPQLVGAARAAYRFEINVRYLDDHFRPLPAIDAGGVSRQLVGDLCQALFSQGIIERYADNMPVISEPLPKWTDSFGALLSLILESGYHLATGCFFDPRFYVYLKRAAEGLSEEQLSIELAKHLPDEPTLGERGRVEAIRWYEGGPVEKSQVMEFLQAMGIDLPEGQSWGSITDEELKAVIKKEVLESFYGPTAKALIKMVGQMTPAARTALLATPDESVSARIQGVPVSAERIKAAITSNEELPLIAEQKKEWVLKRIEDKKDDPEWLSNFTKCITGQSFLPLDARIRLVFVPSFGEGTITAFAAHTCFNSLDVSMNDSSEAEFYRDLDYFIQGNQFNMA